MRIDEQLFFVIPIDGADGQTRYVHAEPIGRLVFDANFLLLSKAFAAIHTEGLGAVAGPRVAALLLRQIGRQVGDPNPADSLLAEIRRLANVVAPTAAGWETLPFEDAVARKVIDNEDAEEVLNSLAFFTVAWHGYPRRTRREMVDGASQLWGAQLSSQKCMDLIASLKTSTDVGNTGAAQAVKVSPPPS